MKYSDLQAPARGGEIDLGRGRVHRARALSPAEVVALRRALPEPEPPVMRSDKGIPLTNEYGTVLRDEGTTEYINKRVRWVQRFRAAQLAVAMDFETSDGVKWDRSQLCDPAEGRQGLGGEKRLSDFSDAEQRRLVYVRSVGRDMLGDDTRDGLLSEAELADAYKTLDALSFGEMVAASAEGNSGSAPAPQQA